MKILFKLNQYNQQRQKEKSVWVYPVMLAMYATFLKNQGHQIIWDGEDYNFLDKVITDESQIDVPFLALPAADRILTKAFDKKWQSNGNFKHLPATYIQSARDCWWGKCTFCQWAKKYPLYEVRSVNDVMAEIDECIALGAKEIFDDSGTFPVGVWLEEFASQLKKRKIKFSCNMRFGALTRDQYSLIKKAGFRMLLYGLESANQSTLNVLNKGIQIDESIEELKLASEAGLEPHVAFMVGYPWENNQDEERTINLVKWLLIKGYAKTAQVSLYMPVSLEEQERMKIGNLTKLLHKYYISEFYRVMGNPLFWYRKIIEIRSIADIKYLMKGLKKGVKHVRGKN